MAIDKIVYHITDGQPRLDRAVEHLQRADGDHRVSAHFLVGRGGEIVQLVDVDDTAWHCSGWNKRSVGIEHIARQPGELSHDDHGLPLTPTQLASSARLVAWLLRELGLGVVAVVPHCSSPATTHRDCGLDVTSGGIWPWADYRSSIQVWAGRQDEAGSEAEVVAAERERLR